VPSVAKMVDANTGAERAAVAATFYRFPRGRVPCAQIGLKE